MSVVYQEKTSATAISGRRTHGIQRSADAPRSLTHVPSTSTHCATSESSASVATERVTRTLERAESLRQMRCPSEPGRNDRNAQPDAKTSESAIC